MSSEPVVFLRALLRLGCLRATERRKPSPWPRFIFSPCFATLGCAVATSSLASLRAQAEPLAPARAFIEAHCANCHDDIEKKGGLDLTSLTFAPRDPKNFARWVTIHDRVQSGEMPPKEKKRPPAEEGARFLDALGTALTEAERTALAAEGRATQRRLNRHEYENALRDLLGAPWLHIKQGLPEDGEFHRFNKIGEALDLSHINLASYLAVAESALRQAAALELSPPAPKLVRYHTRDSSDFARRMKFGLDRRHDRRTFPVLDARAQPEIRAEKQPLTVGAADPATREREAMAVVASNYEPLITRFNAFRAPASGRYRLRIAAYTIWVGPGKGEWPSRPEVWWQPDLNEVSRGRRDEPVVFYADIPPGRLRRIGAMNVGIDPTVGEFEAYLVEGETVRPDCVRLFRSRIGTSTDPTVNPLATHEGQPGVAFLWLDVEGPLPDPRPSGSVSLFGNLPRTKNADGSIGVISAIPLADAERLLREFVAHTYRRPSDAGEARNFLPVVADSLRAGGTFLDAMIAGYIAVLTSPAFLRIEEQPGPLDDHAIAARLAFFLRNSTPDAPLREAARRGELRRPEVLRDQVDRLLDGSDSGRFVEAFLDYWLDLKNIQVTSPDSALYSDYWLDDALLEAAVEETQRFFGTLLREDLPARSIVAADFTFVNERLAAHYALPRVTGVELRRVALPPDSPRGGLLTQASVLKVTANGTTTSPVLRGAWIMERILGMPPPPPPPGIAAVEPDTRGAATIREQLAKHRSDPSCAACHAKIDPAGFALESFDVLGGWRQSYRAVLPNVVPLPGRGHGGLRHVFHHAKAVDPSGELWDGRTFRDVREFKQLLLTEEKQLARNLTRQLATYATGAPVRFSDRAAIEAILERAAARGYGVRTLVHEIVQSELFLNK